ncbi:MAG: energy-coupling factor transporter transmembrane protein EcfT [Planctomycetaceae bacterium]|jgi:hypothetical protein|nr:energy-coupling factor transporter transmembrane protein EcfT [Planctomycetaceae bacterium]
MSNSSGGNQFLLSEIIGRSLQELRRVLRFYVFFDGFILAAFYAFFILAADFLLDWFFQFVLSVRVVLLGLIIFAVVYSLWQHLLRRLFASVKISQLAYLFERYVPELKESLVTVVEAADIKYKADEVAPEFLREALANASDKLRGINVRKFFRSGQLLLRFVGLMLILAATFFLYVKFTETAEIWFSRNLLLSNRDWPRRSRIVVDGFEDGHVRIRRGDSFTMTVRADTKMPLVPDSIKLRIGSDENGYRVILIDQFHVDTVDGSDWRIFSYTFAEMLETLNLQINAADSTISGLKIDVVPPPVLTDIKLLQKFPAYMLRNTRTITPSVRTVIPDGTSIELAVTISKPLVNAKVTLNNNEPATVREEKIEAAFSNFEYAIENLREDAKIVFQFQDTDNLRNKQPVRFELNILKDQPPTVTARFDGIGSLITPNAVLPTLGEITDDNGLANAIYRYKIYRKPKQDDEPKDKNIDNKTATNLLSYENSPIPPSFLARFVLDGQTDSVEQQKTVDTTPNESATETKTDSESADAPTTEGTTDIKGIGNTQTLFAINTEFSVEELQLQVGDKLSLRIEATDKFDLDLPQTGQVGFGVVWEVEVVSPERLKLVLEAREISLRQHFEALIGEVEVTKRLVDVENYSLAPPENLVKEVGEMKIPDDTPEEEKTQKQAELDVKKKELLDTISKEQAVLGQYNISRALRDTQKEVYELRTIVDSFKTIRREMVNNKIFNSESESRIDGGIISPIASLVERDFPELDRLIGIFDKTLAVRDKPLRQDAIDKRKIVLDQIDTILKKMGTIRDNMVAMETYNEIVDILREILKEQKQIQVETEELRKKQIKELLLIDE